MNRLFNAVAIGLTTGGWLLASVLPAAAMPGGPCTWVSDDVASQALGSPAQAIESISMTDLQSCAVCNPAGEDISIMHVTAASPDAPLEGVPMGGPPGPDVQPPQPSPVDVPGYSAVYWRMPVDSDTLLTLRLQAGPNDVYGFVTKDAPDALAQLTALATAVLPHR
jgi:hypothetical protein